MKEKTSTLNENLGFYSRLLGSEMCHRGAYVSEGNNISMFRVTLANTQQTTSFHNPQCHNLNRLAYFNDTQSISDNVRNVVILDSHHSVCIFLLTYSQSILLRLGGCLLNNDLEKIQKQLFVV